LTHAARAFGSVLLPKFVAQLNEMELQVGDEESRLLVDCGCDESQLASEVVRHFLTSSKVKLALSC